MFGGSWGSTLALAYAETHPERVTALVLRGIFLLRRAELRWYYQEGASWLFPDLWEGFLAPIPEAERGDLMAAYRTRLVGDDAGRAPALRQGLEHLGGVDHLAPPQAGAWRRSYGEDDFALAFARIENHYFVHDAWLDEGQLLRDVGPHPRTSPASSSRAATTSAPRRAPRGTSTGPGRRPTSTSSPTPATRSMSRASRTALLAATDRFAGG